MYFTGTQILDSGVHIIVMQEMIGNFEKGFWSNVPLICLKRINSINMLKRRVERGDTSPHTQIKFNFKTVVTVIVLSGIHNCRFIAFLWNKPEIL